MSGRRGKAESDRSLRSDLCRPRGAGWGATPNRCVVTRIWRSEYPRSPARPGRDGRKQQHSISGKMTPRQKNIPLRPHDMTRITHTELGAMNCLARTPGSCPSDRPRVPHACSGAPASAGQRACSVCAMRPELHNMPPPYCSLPGGRGKKTFAVCGKHARPPARTEGMMLWRTHAQTVRCVHSSAFKHIPFSVRRSTITHVASARVHPILLSCARGMKPDRYN